MYLTGKSQGYLQPESPNEKAVQSFPAIAVLALQVDIFHPADPTLIRHEGCQQPVDDAYDERAENSRPEAIHMESRDNPRSHFQHQGVDYEGKKAKGNNINRQSENDKDRAKKSVQYSQYGRRKKSRKDTAHVNTAYYV